MDVYTIAFVAIFLGSLSRTFMTYVKKIGNEPIVFEVKYIVSMLAAIVASCFVASLLIMTITIPDNVVSWAIVFGIGFFQGWGFNDSTNKMLIDWRTDNVPERSENTQAGN